MQIFMIDRPVLYCIEFFIINKKMADRQILIPMRYLIVLNLWVLVLFFSENVFGQKNNNLFTKLDPNQTNIHFNNEVQDTQDYNILIYSNYYGGAGVGVGDINNDGC